MYEALPLLAGIIVALLTQGMAPGQRVATVSVLSLGFGVTAAWVSGELLVSWAYLLIDTALVLVSALMTIAILAWRCRQSGRSA
ncbi:MAG: hypothetical protein M3P51_11295 [Chloroflexota bacterium]|nr:hypothetical protein [Chloroflexota bacterium]